jgi:hypothetical protein
MSTYPLTSNRANRIFIFHTDEFWLNLHHFLYVLGRAHNHARDSSRAAVAGAPADAEKGVATLTEADQKIWRDAVASYADGLSKKDLIFDNPLPAITSSLAAAGDASSLTGTKVDPSVAAILERAGTIYRRCWWPQHREANRAWQSAIEKLLAQHGPAVLAFITRAYKLDWPSSGFPVHVSAYTNWAGAYSTEGNLLVVSSLTEETRGFYGLEAVFHEGMHQWDDQIDAILAREAQKQSRAMPRDLSHALIFFTAGEAIRRVAPAHVPAAEKFGVWNRGMGALRDVLSAVWKPYLDGRGSRDEAFAEIIKRTGTDPGKDRKGDLRSRQSAGSVDALVRKSERSSLRVSSLAYQEFFALRAHCGRGRPRSQRWDSVLL